jgi:hypothetical protein
MIMNREKNIAVIIVALETKNAIESKNNPE